MKRNGVNGLGLLNGGDGPNRSAWADTAPLAICRAALAAVGV